MKFVSTFIAAVVLAAPALADPLPSWNAGAAKSAIIDFVEDVTDPSSENFVPADLLPGLSAFRS